MDMTRNRLINLLRWFIGDIWCDQSIYDCEIIDEINFFVFMTFKNRFFSLYSFAFRFTGKRDDADLSRYHKDWEKKQSEKEWKKNSKLNSFYQWTNKFHGYCIRCSRLEFLHCSWSSWIIIIVLRVCHNREERHDRWYYLFIIPSIHSFSSRWFSVFLIPQIIPELTKIDPLSYV